MTITTLKTIVGTTALLSSVPFTVAHAQTSVTPAEVLAIAKEAYIYGFPMVDNYRIQYGYFVDRENREFKAPWNQIRSIPRVYTPADTAIQTPNSDTPYSFVGMDLRAEPVILTVPPIEKQTLLEARGERAACLIDVLTFKLEERKLGPGGSAGSSSPVQ